MRSHALAGWPWVMGHEGAKRTRWIRILDDSGVESEKLGDSNAYIFSGTKSK